MNILRVGKIRGRESESKGNTRKHREPMENVGKPRKLHCIKGWGKTSQAKFKA